MTDELLEWYHYACEDSMSLPIDVVPNTYPPRFRWTYQGQRMESNLMPSIERAVADLIGVAKRQGELIECLQQEVRGLGGVEVAELTAKFGEVQAERDALREELRRATEEAPQGMLSADDPDPGDHVVVSEPPKRGRRRL